MIRGIQFWNRSFYGRKGYACSIHALRFRCMVNWKGCSVHCMRTSNFSLTNDIANRRYVNDAWVTLESCRLCHICGCAVSKKSHCRCQYFDNFSTLCYQPFDVQSSFEDVKRKLLRWFGLESSKCSSEGGFDQDKKAKEFPSEKSPNPDDEGGMPVAARIALLMWIGFLLYVLLHRQNVDDPNAIKFVSWNEFQRDMLAKGEVEEVVVRPEQEIAFIKLHQNAVIRGRVTEYPAYAIRIADTYKFEDKIRKAEEELHVKPGQGINITYHRESMWASVFFTVIIASALFFFLRGTLKMNLPNPTDIFANYRKAKFVRVDQLHQHGKGIKFKDVAGLKEAKQEIMEFVDYLKRPEKFKALGARIPKGALLLGPPGCGKTLLARAVATEAKVPFLAMAGSEFVEMIGGLGAARVRDLFKEARANAPCIVYLDEIDAIGRRRGDGKSDSFASGEEEQTLNQLLVELDGMDTIEGIIMLASTNRPDILDRALLRPGRFDRHINIDLPTLIERKEIFDEYLKKLQLDEGVLQLSQNLARLSPGMSGADIANICNEAALRAAREQKSCVNKSDLDYAVERVIAGVAKKTGILSPDEKKMVAYHEAGHALVGWLLENTENLLKVTIVPRTSSTLGFAQYTPYDKKLHTKEEVFDKMCMTLGGRVAESITFNKISSGAQNDLEKVTKMAYSIVQEWGMSSRVGHVSFPQSDKSSFGKKPYSNALKSLIDQEAQLMISRAYLRTVDVLSLNKRKLEIIAEELLKKESLTYSDVEQLIGPPLYRKFGEAAA